jgi:ABC-2 type transport system permease protein
MSGIDIAARRTPKYGALNATLLGIEFKRILRNRRAVIFTLVLPVVLYLLIGGSATADQENSAGKVAAYILVSMAVYGAALSCTSGGAMVATERALGWSRQLRLTPLKPVAYVAIKMLVAMSMGAVAIVTVFIVGNLSGAELSFGRLVACGLIGWVCTLVFAAFGLFMGYLLPSENVMQILGPALALLSFAGGLFVPLDQMSDVFAAIAKFTPAYGVGALARAPFGEDGGLTLAVINVVVWTAIFVAGSAWRMSKDTQRV